MRTLLLTTLVIALPALEQTRDLPGLAIAIVEEARRDIGYGPAATHPPVASGPFYIDGQSFVNAFDWISGGNGTAIRDTLIALGYASESFKNLVRQEVDSLGHPNFWLADDALFLRLDGMNTGDRVVLAHVTYHYTYERSFRQTREVCPRRLRIRLLFEAARWRAVETNVVGEC